MTSEVKIGIIICNRYRSCAGGKCFKALKNREGAFEIYKSKEVSLVGYTTCNGCPGGNVEYAPEEMKNNGVDVIHMATGLVVGYPPCPNLGRFCKFIEEKYNINVVVGTHPIPQKYFLTHNNLGTWDSPKWQQYIQPTLTNEETRMAYDC